MSLINILEAAVTNVSGVLVDRQLVGQSKSLIPYERHHRLNTGLWYDTNVQLLEL